MSKKINKTIKVDHRSALMEQWVADLCISTGLTHEPTAQFVKYLTSCIILDMEDIFRRITAYTDFTDQKKITEKFVQASLGCFTTCFNLNEEVIQYSHEDDGSVKSKKRKMRFYAKNTDKLIMKPLIFATIALYTADEFATGLQISRSALVYLQHYLEDRTRILVRSSRDFTSLSMNKLSFVRSIQNEGTTYESMLYSSSDYLFLGIYKVLKQVHSECGITLSAISQINNIISYTAMKLAITCKFIAANFNIDEGIDIRTMKCATYLIIPGEIGKYAVSEGTKAVTKFKSTYNSSNEGRTRSMDAGLTFNCMRVEDIIKRYIARKHVTNSSVVYLSAVLEYLTAEILELSGNAARDNRKYKITPAHINICQMGDHELSKWFRTFGIRIVQSGVASQGFIYPKDIETTEKFEMDESVYEPIHEYFSRVFTEDEGDDVRCSKEMDEDDFKRSDHYKSCEYQCNDEEEFTSMYGLEEDEEEVVEEDEDDYSEDEEEEEDEESEDEEIDPKLKKTILRYIEKCIDEKLDVQFKALIR